MTESDETRRERWLTSAGYPTEQIAGDLGRRRTTSPQPEGVSESLSRDDLVDLVGKVRDEREAALSRIAAALAVFHDDDGLGSASDTLQAMVAALEGEGG
jgi:hypothetical protein